MKLFNTLGLLLSAAMSIHASVHAQSFPNKPINLMVPYPAGGLSDVIARKVNQALAQELKQPVIIENLGAPAVQLPLKSIECPCRWLLHLSRLTQ